MIKAVLFSLVVAGFIFSSEYALAQVEKTPDISTDQGVEALQEGGSLIPPCIRTAEGSRKSNADCVTQSIVFYTNILLVVIAIGAFLYMLYGAFLYATAFGDDSKIGLAKKTITHAIIGIIIAGMSALLVALLKSLLQVST